MARQTCIVCPITSQYSHFDLAFQPSRLYNTKIDVDEKSRIFYYLRIRSVENIHMSGVRIVTHFKLLASLNYRVW